MKIAVVCYEEISGMKTTTEVMADIADYVTGADNQTRLEWGRVLAKELTELVDTDKADICFVITDTDKRSSIPSQIRGISPDLLVTYDLAGFELCTLTDGLSYNLLHCRQIHFVGNRECPNMKYLEKDKSINMFFA